jgi:hypothetical protein
MLQTCQSRSLSTRGDPSGFSGTRPRHMLVVLPALLVVADPMLPAPSSGNETLAERLLRQIDARHHADAAGAAADSPRAIPRLVESDWSPAVASSAPRDGRGKYDRSGGKGSRTAWKPYMETHMQRVNTDMSSFVATACTKNCPNNGTCMENHVSLRVLKQCAAESFGDAALHQQWASITPNHTADRQWFELAYGSRIVESGAVTDVLYRVDGSRVCQSAWAAMRGVPPTTAKTIDRMVRAGERSWNDGLARLESNATRTLKAPLKTAATTWWMTRLLYYDSITTRGVILHPRDVIWTDVYANEFVLEMRLLGHPWKQPSAADREDDEQDDSVRTGSCWRVCVCDALVLVCWCVCGVCVLVCWCLCDALAGVSLTLSHTHRRWAPWGRGTLAEGRHWRCWPRRSWGPTVSHTSSSRARSTLPTRNAPSANNFGLP